MWQSTVSEVSSDMKCYFYAVDENIFLITCPLQIGKQLYSYFAVTCCGIIMRANDRIVVQVAGSGRFAMWWRGRFAAFGL